jgi:hypothetical protein
MSWARSQTLTVTMLVALGLAADGFASEAAAGRWNEKDRVAGAAALQAEPFRLQDVRSVNSPRDPIRCVPVYELPGAD